MNKLGIHTVQDVETLTELARFISMKTPQLLREFAQERALRGQVRMESLDLLEEGKDDIINAGENYDNGEDNVEKSMIRNVVNSLKNVVQKIENKNLSGENIKKIFNGILSGVKDLIPGKLSPLQDSSTTTISPSSSSTPSSMEIDGGLSYFAEWPHICKLLWFPYHTERCGESRCMACAPAMMASAQVCRLLDGRVTRDCIFDTLGSGGFCNFCIRKYVPS